MTYPGNDSSGNPPEPSYTPYQPPAPASPAAYPPAPTPEPPPQPPPVYSTPSYTPPAAPPQYQPAPPTYPAQPTQQPPTQPQPPAQTTQAQMPPVPAPPTYDPYAITTQQYSGAPYPGYLPVPSAIPAPPPSVQGRVATIVLSIATGLLVVIAGVLGALFAVKTSDASDLSVQVSRLTAENQERQGKIESLQKDLDGTKRDLADADNQVDQITTQKKALADCLSAFYDASDALDAAGGQRTPEVTALIAEYDRLCTIADRYL